MGADYYECVDLNIVSKRPGETDTAEESIQVSKLGREFIFNDDDDDDDDGDGDDYWKLPLGSFRTDKLIWEDGQFYVKNEAKYAEYVDAHTVRIYKSYYSYLR
jgi:hypothetical protein